MVEQLNSLGIFGLFSSRQPYAFSRSSCISKIEGKLREKMRNYIINFIHLSTVFDVSLSGCTVACSVVIISTEHLPLKITYNHIRVYFLKNMVINFTWKIVLYYREPH